VSKVFRLLCETDGRHEELLGAPLFDTPKLIQDILLQLALSNIRFPFEFPRDYPVEGLQNYTPASLFFPKGEFPLCSSANT
jgi:hypothetical protein